jgi:hypothetical protein
MPLAELQSEWIADYLIGEYALPSVEEMEAAIHREREAMRQRYGDAPRHTMQVDFAPYVRLVNKERKRGASRAGAKPAAPAKSAGRTYAQARSS